MASRLAIRQQYRTLLLVGEGEADEAFLLHVKSLYVQRGSGLRVTVGCAHGKGAKHVVDYAIRQRRVREYDRIAALLDTDTDWTPAVQQRARQNSILVLKSVPCIEGMLLRTIRQNADGSTRELKARFASFVSNDLDRRVTPRTSAWMPWKPGDRMSLRWTTCCACLRAGGRHRA
ncbi:hypothetical protein [Candidatus Igneacidithiobacillus taiwanensis]|uniref:hypothetical protein n=1 Tax=Candidatus Igneacidithiobacillus taiwanensis TaxID=1945924 RepID=UPI00289BB956|nr:hypothetical protein [Candidatus Igneacidithiobacillus taiwanensis]